MNGLIAWWARNSVAANLVMIGIFVAGVIGFNQMEREMDPQVRFPALQITVVWPGAAPQEVEEQLVARIEESIRDLDAIEWVRSTASEGFGQVTILAEQHGDTFGQRMREFPVRVEVLSRFKSSRQQREVIKATSAGEIDGLKAQQMAHFIAALEARIATYLALKRGPRRRAAGPERMRRAPLAAATRRPDRTYGNGPPSRESGALDH